MTIHPGPESMPSFAKDFRIELLASRSDGNVLVSAKADADQMGRDTSLANLADLVAKQSGWRFDLSLLGPQSPPPTTTRPADAKDLNERQINTLFDDAKRLYDGGFEPYAALAAWAAFESAMRHRVRAMGRKAGYGASPRSLLNELISSGELDHGQFRDLEGLMQMRNRIVHGFEPPPIGRGAIEFLAELGSEMIAGQT